MTPFRIALAGLGTVGRAVAERLLADAELLASRAGGRRLELAAVVARTPTRLDGLPLAPGARVMADAGALAAAGPFDAVVELLGGLGPAGELIRGALERGTSVVTANKWLLAEVGPELESRARASGAALRFEAAVAGGTPVLALLAEDLVAMRVEHVRGVVNGTTNWILDAMEGAGPAVPGMSAADALAAAQAAGYAEADPALDTEGLDAAHKVVVLGRLAFGRWLAIDDVQRVAAEGPGAGGAGIANVTREQVMAAAGRGERIRLVAELMRRDGTIHASVLPRSLRADDPLALARGVTNVLQVEGSPLGTITVSGPGAGGPATASAVIADLVRLANGGGSTWAGLPPASAAPR